MGRLLSRVEPSGLPGVPEVGTNDAGQIVGVGDAGVDHNVVIDPTVPLTKLSSTKMWAPAVAIAATPDLH